MRVPEWLQRFTRLRIRKTMAYFRKVVAETLVIRTEKLGFDPGGAPEDFLTLLLRAESVGGLSL